MKEPVLKNKSTILSLYYKWRHKITFLKKRMNLQLGTSSLSKITVLNLPRRQCMFKCDAGIIKGKEFYNRTNIDLLA